MTSSNEEKSSLEKLWTVWEVMEFPRGRLEDTSTIFCGKFSRKQYLLKKYVKEMGGHVEEGFGPCLLVADLYSIKAPTEKFYRKVYECIQFGNPVYVFQEYEWLQFIGSKGTELPEAHEATVYLKTNFGIEDIKYRNWVKMNLLKREKTQTARELMYGILLFNTLPYICRLYGRYPKILACIPYFDLMDDEKPKVKFFSGVKLVFPNDIPEKRGPVFIHFTVKKGEPTPPLPCEHCEAEEDGKTS